MRTRVYFIRAGNSGPIKIGSTFTHIKTRLASLQTSHWKELLVIGCLPLRSRWSETKLHFEFDDLRIRGEWFRPSKKLLEFIEEHSCKVPEVKITQHGKRMLEGKRKARALWNEFLAEKRNA